MSSGGRRKKAPAGYKPQKQAEVIDQDEAWLQQQQGALGDGNAPAKQPGERKPRKKKDPTMSKKAAARQALREENGNTAEAEAAARADAAAKAAAPEEEHARAAAVARQEALRQAANNNDDEEGEESGYGDDDFEDYGDDFDDDDSDGASDDAENSTDSPGGARSLARAMRAENASAAAAARSLAPASMAKPVMSLLPTREVVSIETKEATRTKADRKALSRSRTRWRDLVGNGLVTLQEGNVDLFDRPPCTLYQVECALGTSGRARRSVQTGEDNITMETQTERPAMKSAGMHAPDDLGLAPGQDQPQGSGLVSQGTDTKAPTGASRLLVGHDRISLDAFLQRALPVVESMLPNALRIAAPPASTGCEGSLSTCYTTLPSPGADLAVRDVHYWRQTNAGGEDRSTLAVAYGTSQSLDAMAGMGMVCVWNARDSREPTEYLRCAGSVTCCWMGELSKGRAAGVVLAGTEEGSLAVWDLAQPRFSHGQTSAERWPSYCTDSLVSENHTSPIVAVRQVPNADDSELAQAMAMSMVGSGNSYAQEEDNDDKSEKSVQVATMDALGSVLIWSLIQLPPDDPGTDLGLGIGGRVKALRMTAIESPAQPSALSAVSAAISGGLFVGALPCFDMSFCPTDSNMLLVSSINGKVHRAARYGTAPAPRVFSSPNAVEDGFFPETDSGPEFDGSAAARYRERGVGASEDVLCVDWSPFCPDFFAAAVADGTVAVYGLGASRPRLVLAAPSNVPLLAVRWSCDRPSILFALDAGSTVFAWDLRDALADTRCVSPSSLLLPLRSSRSPQTSPKLPFRSALSVT